MKHYKFQALVTMREKGGGSGEMLLPGDVVGHGVITRRLFT